MNPGLGGLCACRQWGDRRRGGSAAASRSRWRLRRKRPWRQHAALQRWCLLHLLRLWRCRPSGRRRTWLLHVRMGMSLAVLQGADRPPGRPPGCPRLGKHHGPHLGLRWHTPGGRACACSRGHGWPPRRKLIESRVACRRRKAPGRRVRAVPGWRVTDATVGTDRGHAAGRRRRSGTLQRVPQAGLSTASAASAAYAASDRISGDTL